METQNRRLVSVTRAAKEIGVSWQLLTDMVDTGKVPFYSIGKRKRVVVSEVLSATARAASAPSQE